MWHSAKRTLRITDTQHNNALHNAESSISFIVMPSVVMLSVVTPFLDLTFLSIISTNDFSCFGQIRLKAKNGNPCSKEEPANSAGFFLLAK
jgi:hypothetical protein